MAVSEEDFEGQLVELAEWKKNQERKIRRITWTMIFAVALVAIGGILGIWRVESLTNETHETTKVNTRLIASNSGLIERVDKLNRDQAMAAYRDCVIRNRQTLDNRARLARLVDAHRRDGSFNAAHEWSSYLEKLKMQRLPPCKKPDSKPTK